jgi:hypothetical protein
MAKVWTAIFSATAIAGAATLATAAHAVTPLRVRLDTQTNIHGFDVACTGIGESKAEPRWRDYPVRVEFADSVRDYLAGETVTLAPLAGAPILSVTCNGPWLLVRPPDKSAYRLEARLSERYTHPQSALLKAPDLGQKRLVLTFPKGY